MNRQSINLTFLLSTFLLGVMPSLGADFMNVLPCSIEPGETGELTIALQNNTDYYGFQADLYLPDGLELVDTNGKAVISLSERCDGFASVSNIVSDICLRFGIFSLNHEAITGSEGDLLNVTVRAESGFTGGAVTLSGILMTGAGDTDVPFPETSTWIGATKDNRLEIEPMSVKRGESALISLSLDNETPFSAFQTDLYLPEGMTLIDDSLMLPDRASGNHTLSAKSFTGGRTRITCIALDGTTFTGNAGTLLTAEVVVDNRLPVQSDVYLKNTVFSTPSGKEYHLEDSFVELDTPHINSFTISPYPEIRNNKGVISMILENETPFSAFQTDLYLPEGMTIVENSIRLSDRASGNHTLSAKSFSDGRTRITCIALDGTTFTGNVEVLMTAEVELSDPMADSYTLTLRNSIFSTPEGTEYHLEDSQVDIDTLETGIPSHAESGWSIKTNGGKIILKDICDKTAIAVCGLDGTLYYETTRNGAMTEIPLPSPGIYLIRVGQSTKKLIVR